MAVTVPLFPLSHVLLPGMPLPLHIFEPRYRALVEDLGSVPGTGAQSAGRPSGPAFGGFGVVALRAGAEVASRSDDVPDVADVGTIAEVLDLERNEDGTSDLLAVGSRRFRITALVPLGKPYLRAEVEFLDERDGPLSDELVSTTRALLRGYDGLLRRLAGRATGDELPTDPAALSYQVAARLPLAPPERQALLADETTAQRLARLAGLLRREVALLRGTRSIAVSPAVLRLAASDN